MAVRFVVHTPVSMIRRTLARGNYRFIFICVTVVLTLLLYSVFQRRSWGLSAVNPSITLPSREEAVIKQVSTLVNIARDEQTKSQEHEAAKASKETVTPNQLNNMKSVQAYKVLQLERNKAQEIGENVSMESALKSSNSHILMLLAKVTHVSPLARRFQRCIQSICAHTSKHLIFHIITDSMGEIAVTEVFPELMKLPGGKKVKIFFYHMKQMTESAAPLTKQFKEITGFDNGSYYSDPLFFLSLVIHQILSTHIQRIIILDSDLIFKNDIGKLFEMFDEFNNKQIIGIAREQQPVYRHTFYSYRSKHPKTAVGEPPPDGLTGFNSGVVLMDLERMRVSEIYNEMILKNVSLIRDLSLKYEFKGHLGDQDIFTLIGLEHLDLFYILPCQWNRQLCIWWKDKGYNNVFDLYFNCPDPIHVYHGNCGTQIPDG